MSESDQVATVRVAKRLTRGMISELESAFGAERALPATKHAAALYDSLSEMERAAEQAKASHAG